MRKGAARRLRKPGAILLGMLFTGLGLPLAWAEDERPLVIEFKDGEVSPVRIEVPANRKFELELRNVGDTPAEFESSELHREKVLAPKTASVLVFTALDPGEYPFFDDFHPDSPKAFLIAR